MKRRYLLSLILLPLAFAAEVPLPRAEYDQIRAAEEKRNAALHKLNGCRKGHCKAEIDAAAGARAEYRRIFQEIEAKHKGYLIQPERLTLIKKP